MVKERNIRDSNQVSVLYISYDGLLDPLGGSQILPYIKGVAIPSRNFNILSFEKKHRLAEGYAALKGELEDRNISWKPITFTRDYGLAGKLWDLARMYFFAWRIASSKKVAIVHSRGHAAAQVGSFLKRRLGLKFIFDFRGLWVDERVDKGGWDLSRSFDLLQYRYFKIRERELLSHADRIVVLTRSVVDEICQLGALTMSKITVIPCCADFGHFLPLAERARIVVRRKLGFPDGAFVIGYIGSIGRLYLIDRYLSLFQIAARLDDLVHGLVITNDTDEFNQLVEKFVPKSLQSRLHVYSVARAEVPFAIGVMDVSVCFIRPSYARMATSPTKLAESFAMGVPAICNAGVGDVEEQLEMLNAGVIVDPNSDQDLSRLALEIRNLSRLGGAQLRKAAEPLLGLHYAIDCYERVYANL